MTNWNYSMAKAPRGHKNTTEDAKGRAIGNFIKDWVLLSVIESGKPRVVLSYRTEPTPSSPTGWWAGCVESQVYAWAPCPEPAAPRA